MKRDTCGFSEGRSGAGQVKASVLGEEVTTPKPVIVGGNVPHSVS